LNTGNPATFGFGLPKSIENALKNQLERGVGYCDFRGMPDARRAICEYEKSKGIQGIEADDVFIGNGVSEVVSFALFPLLNPGDEVLVPAPSYSLWGNSVYLAGGKPVFYVCDEKSHWYPDIADIRSKITEKTKAIVVINPNNPTGVLYPVEILEEIIKVAREHGLLVFADEIYDRLVMDGLQHTSLASLADDIPVITMNGLSKSHCLCGYRCGWMVIRGPRHLTDEYRQGIVQLTSMRLCANTLSQIIIPAALEDMETPHSMVAPGGRIYEQREATIRELKKIDG
jgi:alanine-synthesizing transaminase